MKYLFITLFTLCLINNAYTQEALHQTDFASQTLKVGDSVPDIVLPMMKNYKKNYAKLSEFRGKLLILDFWNRYCEPCIAAFPELQELQSKFGNQIQIVLVNNDNLADVNRLFKTSPIVAKTTLPFVLTDTVLNKLFPHIGVPFHVWIDANGVVRQVTNGNNTTKGNIDQFLKGHNVKLPERYEAGDRSLVYEPLLVQLFKGGERQRRQLQTYSLIMKKSQLDSRTGWKFDNSKDSTIQLLNCTIITLFNAAYLAYPYTSQIHITTIIEPRDSSGFARYYSPIDIDKYGEWIENNSYCYEFKPPVEYFALDEKTRGLKEKAVILQDLERYFNVHTTIEKRTIKTIVLYRDSTKHNFVSKGGKSMYEVTGKNIAVFRNQSVLGSFIKILHKYFSKSKYQNEIPIIDETKYTGTIDGEIKLSDNLVDIDKEFRKYGFFVKEENRTIECLIIKED